jgi:hypothetical protein
LVEVRMSRRQRSLVIAGLCTLGVPAPLPADEADWLVDDGNVLELKLAHLDRPRPDGGILRIDRGKRLLSWEGIARETGCKLKVEASFEDVKSVEIDEQQAGFTLRLKRGKPKELVLIPVEHVAAFALRPELKTGGLQTALANAPLRGPGGDPMQASGSAAGAAPSAKKLELPAEVVAATRKAVAAIRGALALER